MTSDRMALRFEPTSPLKPATLCTVHVGARMLDEWGEYMSLGMHGPDLGGDWVTGSMTNARRGSGDGCCTRDHCGGRVAYATNGAFGIAFTFTTAG